MPGDGGREGTSFEQDVVVPLAILVRRPRALILLASERNGEGGVLE